MSRKNLSTQHITCIAITLLLSALLIQTCLAESIDEFNALLSQGTKAYDKGDYFTAINILKKGLLKSRKIGYPSAIAKFGGNLGLAYQQIRDHATAIPLLKESFEIFKGLSMTEEAAQMSACLAISLESKSNYYEALDYFKTAVSIYEQLRDDDRAMALNGKIAGLYYMLNKHEEAIPILKKMERYYKSNNDTNTDVVTKLGTIFFMQGKFEEAIPYLEQMVPLYRGTDKEEEMLRLLSSAYGQTGRVSQAKKTLRSSLDISRSQDSIREADALAALAAYESLDYETPRTFFKNMTDYGETAPTDIKSLLDSCLIKYHCGEYMKAISLGETALAKSTTMRNFDSISDSLTILGYIYLEIGQPEKGLSYFKHALNVEKKARNLQREGTQHLNIGNACNFLRKHNEAIQSYGISLDIAKRTNDKMGEANALGNLGIVYLAIAQTENRARLMSADNTQFEKALSYFKKASAILLDLNNGAGEAIAMDNLGCTYLALGQYRKAAYYLEESLKRRSQTETSFEKATALNNLGVVYLFDNKVSRAEEYFLASAAIFEKTRSAMKSEEMRCSFSRAGFSMPYNNLVKLYHKSQRFDEALYTVERTRSRSFVDILGTKELKISNNNNSQTVKEIQEIDSKINTLQRKHTTIAMVPEGQKTRMISLEKQIESVDKDRLKLITQLKKVNPEFSDLLSVTPSNTAEIRSYLSRKDLIIEYYHCGDSISPEGISYNLFIFLITKDRISLKNVPVLAIVLDDKISNLRSLLTDQYSELAGLRGFSEELYKLVLLPLINEVENYKNIIIVPHGSLHHLPFAALYDGKEYFGDKYNITTLPSGSVLKYVLKKRKSNRGSILALGNPKTNLAPLKEAEREVDAISKLFEKRKTYTGRNARESVLKNNLAGWDVVHLACHGLFDPDHPELSYLALTSDKEYDGRLALHELFGLDLSGTSLVTLSACSSGKGKVSSGDDIVGFSRGLIFAGTPSILATLWEVDDKSTREFMESFYRHYTSGRSKAESLRKARIEIRRKYPHPYHWAPFVLIGDWQ